MGDRKYEYAITVCNFLNNTQGYILDYQTRFLLLHLFDLKVDETIFEKYFKGEIEEKLNNIVACDYENDFYECLYFDLYELIKFKESEEYE